MRRQPVSAIHAFTFTWREFSKCFYPKRLTVNTHIHTPTAESTMQGGALLSDISTLLLGGAVDQTSNLLITRPTISPDLTETSISTTCKPTPTHTNIDTPLTSCDYNLVYKFIRNWHLGQTAFISIFCLYIHLYTCFCTYILFIQDLLNILSSFWIVYLIWCIVANHYLRESSPLWDNIVTATLWLNRSSVCSFPQHSFKAYIFIFYSNIIHEQ